MLNPTDKVAVTVSSAALKTTVLIPTPAPLCVGMIVGVTLFIPLVFFRISTLNSPRVTFKLTSVTSLPVLPSNTISLGGTENPLPNDVMPTISNDAKESILIIWGRRILGLSVGSDGKLNPISSNIMFLREPTLELFVSKIAPLPARVFTVVIPGSE